MGRRDEPGPPPAVTRLELDLRRRGLRVCVGLAGLSLVYAAVQLAGAVLSGSALLAWIAALAVAGGLVDLGCAALVARGRVQVGMALFATNVLLVLAVIAVLLPEQVVTVVVATLLPVVFSMQFLDERTSRTVAAAGLAVAVLAMVSHGVLDRRSGLDPELMTWVDLGGGLVALVGLVTVFVQARGVVTTRTGLLLTTSADAEQRRSRLDLAEQQQRLTSQFVRLVSHELRTPLSSILGYTELMQDAEGDLEPAERQQMLAVVGANARRLDVLVGDLLDVARLDAGQVRLEYRTVDAATVLAEIADVLRPVLERRRQTLLVEVPRPLELPADPRRLEQVLANLVSNAQKYSAEGACVRVRAETEGEQSVFTVRDEGIGMDAEDLDRLFTTFFRSERAQVQSAGGTGLGLVLSSYLVQLHGGTIAADSELGRGSTFTVRLPLTVAAAQPAR
ncbi:sensor histidine kinase [Nocardioides nanhaiensis]|uniref:histidine kinase n=1 Tax=Nocardioides nanhaiensis TaxID=1476871 RepID=A0ABP8WC34_9ACTN